MGISVYTYLTLCIMKNRIFGRIYEFSFIFAGNETPKSHTSIGRNQYFVFLRIERILPGCDAKGYTLYGRMSG